MANRYWVGGTGNWSDNTNHWSASSGGAPGASKPTADDNVIFDTSSSTAEAAYTMTIDEAAYCLDFTMDGPSTTDATKVTWAGSSALAISGNLTLTGGTAGITNSYIGTITFNATSGTKTIDWNSVISGSSIIFNGSGGTFQLSRDIEFQVPPSYGAYLTRTAGTFDANGKKITVNVTGGVYFQGLGFTGTSSFYDLTIVGYAAKDRVFQLNTNITVTHTLLLNGNSATNRILVRSNIIGTPRTIDITGTTGNSFSNVDFRDIAMVTGGADLDLSAITGGSGDCGGNSGITFTAPQNNYFYKVSGNSTTSTVGDWYLGTGGSGGAGRVPLPQDMAIYDDLSFGAAGMTVTQDMPRIPTTTFKGVDGLHTVANNPTWTTSTATSVFGSLTLDENMTLTASTQTYTFEGRAAGMPVGGWTLTSAGKTWAKNLTFNCPTGVYVPNGDIVQSGTAQINFTKGEFDNSVNNANITTYNIVTSTGFILRMGTNTLYSLSKITGQVWGINPGATLYCGTSTIKFVGTMTGNNTFDGGSKTYNKVWFSMGTSTYSTTITGNNTFAELKDDGSEQHSLLFTAGTTQTGTAPGWFKVNGSTTGKEIIVNSTTTGTFNLVNAGGGVVSCDYLDIQHSVATPLNSWYAGANSINHQSDATAGSGWIFSTPPSASTITTNRGRNRFKFTPVSQG